MDDKNSLCKDFCQAQPLLIAHLEAVLLQNKTMNLTSINNLEAGKVLHIMDSLAVLPEVNAAPEGTMADLGSGAGYPGIPLAITSGRDTTLIEANKKKARFLQGFLDAHDLSGKISVAAMRSEELAKSQRGKFAVVTARAVAELPILLELAAPLLIQGGHFLALKGKPDTEELVRGDTAAGAVGMEYLQTRDCSTSDSKTQRCVLVYKRTKEPSLDLPRRPGMAAKRPLA